jgi:ornithine carbamoyltransferase
MVLGAMAGIQIAVATPEGFEADPEAVQLAESVAIAGGAIELTNDPQSAAAEADAVYTDVWVSMGEEDSDAKKAALAPYQLSGELLAHAKPEAIALHCLPAHVGEEITEDALYGPRSAIFDQAENRLHVQKALLEYLMS